MKIAKIVRRVVKARFVHDCEECRFLGRLDGVDLYFCPNHHEFVARRGNAGGDCGAWPVGEPAPEGSPYAFANKLDVIVMASAVARRLPTDRIPAHCAALAHEWRSEA